MYYTLISSQPIKNYIFFLETLLRRVALRVKTKTRKHYISTKIRPLIIINPFTSSILLYNKILIFKEKICIIMLNAETKQHTSQ